MKLPEKTLCRNPIGTLGKFEEMPSAGVPEEMSEEITGGITIKKISDAFLYKAPWEISYRSSAGLREKNLKKEGTPGEYYLGKSSSN